MASDAPTSTDADAGPSAAVQWGIDYVGGTAAEATGDPIRIGYASDGNLFPDSVVFADATADYINKYLGGIDGRPVEIVHCNMSVPEDGATCATQFANDDSIVLAMVGQALSGNADFYATINGKKPVYTGSPSGIDDFVSTVSVSYFTGALGASFGIAQFVLDDLKPKTVAFVITDDAAGRGGFSLIQPIMSRDGATVNPVFVQPTATAPEIESAMQAVQVDTADVIVIGMFEQGCIASYDALKNLGIDPTKTSVVAVAPCHGAAMQAHMSEVGEPGILPNGWYFTGQGYNIFTGNAESGTDTVIDILDKAGKSEALYSVGSEEMISGLVTVVKHLNSLDGDFSIDKVTSAIRDFTGPVMSAAGPMKCGGAATFPGICGMQTSVERYIDGGWEATRSSDNSVDFASLMGFSV